MKKMKILIIEDEPSIADNLEYALSTEGFEAITVHTGQEGLNTLESNDFELIILDIGLPDINGFDICKNIRKKSEIPIIFLTARDAEVDRIVGLEIGGDDYVTKPFSPREVTARVRAILRRVSKSQSSTTRANPDIKFQIFEEECQILYYGNVLSLTQYEYKILKLMIEMPGKVFSRKELMEKIWDAPEMTMTRSVDTHIKTLRGKLKAIAPDESPIVTKRGFGYKIIL